MAKANYPGSSYYKIDLHVHTPQSKDYRGTNVQPKDIVEAALNIGLDAIAITDHNDYRYIDNVKAAAEGTHLTVFPGVEISTRDGHLLAILDPAKSGDDVRTLLISCGLTSETKYGEQHTLCNRTIEDVAVIVQNAGGIAIAAHFDGVKGFKESVGVGEARIRIFQSRAIEAVELVNTDTKEEWVEGRVWDKSRACIQGSDAHSLEGIGQRVTWLRVAKLNIQGLRLAFRDPKVRIRFPDEYDELKPRSYIECLEISQGFFQTLRIDFNPGLNCLIGGQGVGKSALIEFIRFGLNNLTGVSDIKKDHIGKLDQLLGLGGSVSITIRTSDGLRLIVTRTYNGNENPIRTVKILDDGTHEPYPLDDISRYFVILAYSQSEGMSIARDAVRQLELIDSHIDLSGQKDALEGFRRQLHDNTIQLQQNERNLGDIPDLQTRKANLEREVNELMQKLQEIDAVQKEPALKNAQHWNDELTYLQSVTAGLKQLQDNALEQIHSIEFHPIERTVPESQIGNDAELQAVSQIALQAKQYIQSLETQIQSEFDRILREARESQPPQTWLAKYREHQKDYEQASKRIGNVRVNDLQNRLRNKKFDLDKVDVALKQALSQQQKKTELTTEREKLLNHIERELAVISTKRKSQAESMSKALRGRVQISILPSKNRQTLQNWLETNTRNRQFQSRHLQALVESSISPRELAKLIRQKKNDDIAKSTGLSPNSVETFVSLFVQTPGLVYELEEVLLEDLPDIRMKRNDGEYRELDKLSTGQKFTVIILLALTDDDKPIVYDQPEDALDTAMIYSDIAQILRTAKDHRQFIFATHNSNMSVSADLDLAVILEGTASSSQVSHVGGLEQDEVKHLLVEYLEGGTEAMQQRVSKYGYEPL